MNIKAVYSGRFQPFGRHHKQAFDWLCSKFGRENCWIATSGKVDDRSPLTFDEKKSIIKKYGIDNIIQADNPYRSVIPNIDPQNTILFVMLGAKDDGRIQYFKKDGTSAYYREYYGQKDLEPMSTCGYIIIAPHISIRHGDNELSGTYIRKTLSFAPQSTFSEIMGFYDPDIEKVFQNRFGGEIEAFSDMVSSLPKYDLENVDVSIDLSGLQGSTRRHICHLYEANLDPEEIISILYGLSSGEIIAYEKFDGINLKAGIRNGEVVFARNKVDMKNPVDIYTLADRYIDRPHIRRAFMDGCKILTFVNLGDLGENWLNVEIVHPDLKSVYRYGTMPFVVIHGVVDSENRKVNEAQVQIIKYSSRQILPPNQIVLPQMPLYLSQMASQIRKGKNLEQIVNKIGYELLSKAIGYESTDSNILGRLYEVGELVARSNDSKIRQKYFDNLEKLDFGKILPFEGIVFEWKGVTYKMTGYFKYINQILHLFER